MAGIHNVTNNWVCILFDVPIIDKGYHISNIMTKTVKLLFFVSVIVTALSVFAAYYKYYILEEIETYFDDYGEGEYL